MALHGLCRFAAPPPVDVVGGRAKASCHVYVARARQAGMRVPSRAGEDNVTAFLVDSYTDSCIGYGIMQPTNVIPPLRPGWADARIWPVTVSLLRYWENPHAQTLCHIAALQLYRCERAGLPPVIEVSVG